MTSPNSFNTSSALTTVTTLRSFTCAAIHEPSDRLPPGLSKITVNDSGIRGAIFSQSSSFTVPINVYNLSSIFVKTNP